MIVGTTVAKTGELIQRLPVSTKLAIGLAPSGAKHYPERLDHFLVMRRGPDKGSWVLDAEKMRRYAPECMHEVSETCQKCCREIKILLLDDEISNVFPHQLAWWGRTGKKCWGDGETAMRRKDDTSDPAPWTPCRNAGCPDWEAGRCSGSGDLRFCLADYPILGSISRIHTSSLKSIENIASALNLIQNFTGGRLAGVTVPLCVTMEPTTYMEDGKRKSTIVPILSIKTGVNELIANIKNTMELWGTARKAFGRVVVDDDDDQRSTEIPPEFPARSEQPKLPSAGVKAEPHAPDLGVNTKAAETQASAAKPPEKPAEKPVESATPAVQKVKATFEGFPKSLSVHQLKSGSRKGADFWKLTLTPTGTVQSAGSTPDMELIVFSSTLKEKLEGAIKRSQEVQLPCEIRIGSEAQKAVVVEDVAFVARPAPASKVPEVPVEPTDWWQA